MCICKDNTTVKKYGLIPLKSKYNQANIDFLPCSKYL